MALGIDIGTSGVRAAALSAEGSVLHIAAHAFADAASSRSPAAWWRGVTACLEELAGKVSLSGILGIAVDGTSGTVLAVDGEGAPIGEPLMYNDLCPDTGIVERIARHAPPIVRPAAHPPRWRVPFICPAAWCPQGPAPGRLDLEEARPAAARDGREQRAEDRL